MRRRGRASWAVQVIAPWFLSMGVLVSFTASAGQDPVSDADIAPLTARTKAGVGPAALMASAMSGDFGLYGQNLLLDKAKFTVGEPGDLRSIPDEREPHVELKPNTKDFPQVDRSRKGDPVVAIRPTFETRLPDPAQLGLAVKPALAFRVDGARTTVSLAPRAEMPSETSRTAAIEPLEPPREPATTQKSAVVASPTQAATAATPSSAATTAAAPPAATSTVVVVAPTAADALVDRAAHGATPQVTRAVALGSSTPAQPDAVPIAVSFATLALAAPKAEPGARPDYAALISQEKLDSEMRCLAEAVYFESRSEPEAGQAAVAQVVLNRVSSGLYPTNVCGVVYQNRHHYKRCQFSFACEGKSLRITERESWERAVRVAHEVMGGQTWLADVGRSTHYHATYVKPRWARSLTRMDSIGRHIFYKLKPGQT